MYRLLKRVVISGHPGTGTTTLVDKLALLYNLKPEQKIKVGDLFRENSKEKTGHDITSYYQREITEDLSIDNMQKELLSDPNPKVVYILESRLGGFFAQEIRDNTPPIVTVLMTTDDQVRFKRVFDRDRQKNPHISFDKYCAETKLRQEKDLKQWQEAYPRMHTDPLDPANAALYDIHVDNTNLDIEQTVQAVNSRLLESGAAEKTN
ncbi:AAA family ATPase [Candidatus Daviesbacteria bacterium]|nr:AAA family ATPase [Candidatus Daviesbacteria bacterium]